MHHWLPSRIRLPYPEDSFTGGEETREKCSDLNSTEGILPRRRNVWVERNHVRILRNLYAEERVPDASVLAEYYKERLELVKSMGFFNLYQFRVGRFSPISSLALRTNLEIYNK